MVDKQRNHFNQTFGCIVTKLPTINLKTNNKQTINNNTDSLNVSLNYLAQSYINKNILGSSKKKVINYSLKSEVTPVKILKDSCSLKNTTFIYNSDYKKQINNKNINFAKI